MIKRWTGEIGGYGRRLVHRYDKTRGREHVMTGSEYEIYMSVGITSGPEASKGRRVDLNMTPAFARLVASNLIRLADDADKANES